MNVKSTRALFCLNMTISALLLEQTNVSPPLLFSFSFICTYPFVTSTPDPQLPKKDHQTPFRYVSVQNWWVWGMFKTLPWEELDSRIRKDPMLWYYVVQLCYVQCWKKNCHEELVLEIFDQSGGFIWLMDDWNDLTFSIL